MDGDCFGESERERLEQNLFIMSRASGQLSYIPHKLLEYNHKAISGVSIYDIYLGTFSRQRVAIKKARGFACVRGTVEVGLILLFLSKQNLATSDRLFLQHILKEANNWRSACELDPNEEYILKLIGVSFPENSFM